MQSDTHQDTTPDLALFTRVRVAWFIWASTIGYSSFWFLSRNTARVSQVLESPDPLGLLFSAAPRLLFVLAINSVMIAPPLLLALIVYISAPREQKPSRLSLKWLAYGVLLLPLLVGPIALVWILPPVGKPPVTIMHVV